MLGDQGLQAFDRRRQIAPARHQTGLQLQRLQVAGRGAERLLDGRRSRLGLPCCEIGAPQADLQCGHGQGVAQRRRREAGEQHVVAALLAQGAGHQGHELVGVKALAVGAIELGEGRCRIALPQQGRPEQEARLCEGRVLLQRIPELDRCGRQVAGGQPGLAGGDELAGARAKAAHQQRHGHQHRGKPWPAPAPHAPCRHHLICSRFIRSYSVGRLMPSNSAARTMLPSVRDSAVMTAWRSAFSRTARRSSTASSLAASGAARRPRSAAVMRSSSAMMTARLSMFCSSRTLPGQRCDSSARTASSARVGTGRRISVAKRRAKACDSSTGSPKRSRSGGISTTISARR
mmetsp:Transcript_21076/g.81764  ORF Transcript_21076/g.81764 Transcript_21076/m.81764 type:complete len:347 (-) Transcript_21076:2227-3267(-)